MELNLHCFMQNRLVIGVISFHNRRKRNNLKPFSNSERTVKMKIDWKMSILKVNSNIIANVISQSAKSRKTVDFKEALKHPLCTVTLRIASASEGSEQTRAIKELLQRLVFQMPLFQTYHSTLMLILLIRWQKCDLCMGIQTVLKGLL